MRSLRSPRIVLVHQMGKVGSSSIGSSLRAMGVETPVFQTHFLNPERLWGHIERKRQRGHPLLDHLTVSIHLRKLFEAGLADREWKVITLVRDPVARGVSAFFENIELHIDDFSRRHAAGEISMDDIAREFLSRSPDLPLNWLDAEIRDVFGIDVYASEFPKAEGYKIYAHGSVDLLLLKLELLDTCCVEAFDEFLGITGFELCNDNVAENKYYRDIYRGFREQIAIPREQLDRMYASRFVRHFYSEEEIAAFRRKWSRTEGQVLQPVTEA